MLQPHETACRGAAKDRYPVTVPLIIDHDEAAGLAIRASIRASFENIPAMIVWSALILLLTLVGNAPLLFGMIVITPLPGHATWHAYRDLVGWRPAADLPHACFNRPRRKSAMISRAELWPGAPVTPPPGCVPEPHMYSPCNGPR